jgi:hypothetical protein
VEYVVAMVLDPNRGTGLHEIAREYDLWVVNSRENRRTVEELWAAKAAGDVQHEVTIWSNPLDLAAETSWRSMLGDIELHHGEYSHDPPVTTLEVIGATPNDAARAALAEYGYNVIEHTETGFRARLGSAV